MKYTFSLDWIIIKGQFPYYVTQYRKEKVIASHYFWYPFTFEIQYNFNWTSKTGTWINANFEKKPWIFNFLLIGLSKRLYKLVEMRFHSFLLCHALGNNLRFLLLDGVEKSILLSADVLCKLLTTYFPSWSLFFALLSSLQEIAC